MQHREFGLHLAASVQYCYQNALNGKGVIAKDKLNDLLSFLLSKVKPQKRQEEQSGSNKNEN